MHVALERAEADAGSDHIGRRPADYEEARDAFHRGEQTPFPGRRDVPEADRRELRVFGDWAYLRNYLEMTMAPPDGGTPVRRSGYTLTILRKEADGRWRLAHDANLLAPASSSRAATTTPSIPPPIRDPLSGLNRSLNPETLQPNSIGRTRP